MSVELNDITSGYSTGLINDNFQLVEDELNNNVLRRNGLSSGEANHMEVDLDMNSNFVYNLPEPILEHQAARLQDVQNAVAGGAANLITFTPYGSITSENVQGAIQELEDSAAQDPNTFEVDTNTGTQTLQDALNSRTYQVVTPEMFGATGDGVASDKQAWIDALASGYTVEGVPGSIYNVEDGFPINNGKIRMGGSLLRLTTDINLGTGGVAFSVTGRSHLDELRVEIPTGVIVDQVVSIDGSFTSISSLHIDSVDQQNNRSTASVVAVNVTADNVNIGSVVINNYDNGMRWGGDFGFLGTFSSVSFVRALWLEDVENFRFNHISTRVTSPNATSAAGMNGLLMQDVRYIDGGVVDIRDASEHAIRFSGSTTGSRDVKINRISAINAGQSGVKWRCATGVYNNRIDIGSIYCEDCGDEAALLEGHSALRIDRVQDMTIGQVSVVKFAKTFSCGNGISIFDCFGISIGTVKMEAVGIYGIKVRTLSTDDASNPIHRDTWDITVAECSVKECEDHMVFLEARNEQFRRIHINVKGKSITGAGFRAETFNGGSIAEDCLIKILCTQTGTPSADVVSGNALNSQVLLEAIVDAAPGTTTASNGSTWWDLSGGIRYIREQATGNWIALN